ncbi:InlB B-repeat-containing protein [Paenibacillus endoradicis]|uniref:InlB B-repeat-containing protein n=1 Tax=Paenibacillus endoradicis TaxID=2972487 RepID=UPI0021594AE8|nr:InlB B-repeat-containing protein [Paenibacillus endoradicis]MCR8660583.1 InlB B-repeat-containing protein [Paenibacillus endoradicis]
MKTLVKFIQCLLVFLLIFTMLPLSQVAASASLDIGTNRIDIEIEDDLDSYIWSPPVVVGNKLFIPWFDWAENQEMSTVKQYYSVIHSDGTVDTLLATPVSPTTSNIPPDIFYKGLSNGNVLIYWYSSSSSNGLTDTYFKIVNQSGTQVVAPTKINSSPGSLNRFTEVTQLTNGNLAFVWDTNEASYALRRFTTTGVAVDTNQISITGLAGISGSQYTHRITANNSGQFMISISYYDTTYRGMIFNDTGTTPIQIGGQNSFIYGTNTETPNGNQYVKALSNNKFLFVYHKKAGLDVNTRSIYYRIYNADGTPYTNEILVDTINTWGAVYEPIITDDGFILSYSFNNNIVNNNYFQQYNNAGVLQSDSSPDLPELEGDYAIGFLFKDVDGKLSYIANEKTSGAASYDTWLLRHLTSGPTSYDVIFQDWDGIELKSETVNHGNAATAPPNPSRVGYTFAGWDVAYGNITSALTVTAKYDAITYTVSFASQGGSTVGNKNGTYGSTITAPTPPTRANYTFGGWYKEAGTENQWDFTTETIPANNITLYAKWNLNSYAVIFEDWDGNVLKNQTVNHGSAATAPANPSQIGYTFTGWDVAYGNITGALTLKAQYSVNSYNVIFDSQGGSIIGNKNAAYGSTITAPIPPTRANYTFGGWYKEAGTENQWDFTTETIPANNITLYAKWNLNSYVVIFEDWDGNVLKNQTVNHGSAATAPANPSRIGYTFTSWDVAYGNITGALTVKAQYSVNSYTVIFDSQGGSTVGNKNTTYGSKITAPTPPTREGYTFDGWYKEADAQSRWIFTTDAMPANDVTLYANWTLNSYMVTFEDWNGDLLKNAPVNHGSGAIAPADPSREGYTFTGWDVDYGNITGSLTVKAQYRVNSYTVSFDSQSGSIVNDITANYGSKITAPNDPTRVGYTFDGWYKENDAQSQWNFVTETIPAHHVTLYANWILNSYTVTFEDWDGTELNSGMVNHGSGATAPVDPSRIGYTFTGWDVAFGNISGSLTVKAQYSVNSYTVGFDSQSGSTVDDITANYGSKITAPTPPTREGYTFEGWYKETDAQSRWDFVLETIPAQHVTLYANWVLNSYTVTFEDWDGTELNTGTVNHGSGATAPVDPSRIGYTFTGWDVAFGNISGSLTVKAQYSLNSYKVSFNSQRGSTVGDITETYGSKITAPTPPTRANHRFVGWYKEEGTVNKWDFLIDTMQANDVTLYAKWIYQAPSNDDTKQDDTEQYINITVDDQQEKIGIVKITKENGQDVATVTIDSQILLQLLGNESNKQITIPTDLAVDKVTLVLNGQLIKDLAQKNIIIVLETRGGQYKLPTSEIDMDSIAEQLDLESLEKLALSIEISELTAEEEMLVANSLVKGDYTLVAPPVQFSVYVAYGKQKIELSKFQVYVERYIAVPEGTDISKISTAVVIGKDGTIRHVPTKIEHIKGKDFAVIHSLSNSIYALIWNPVSFVDVEKHWSRDAVNNMASRMIISGTGNGIFQPDKFISRAEFAAIIVRALGIELEPGTVPFSDVNQNDWYFNYVKAAYEYGIINGYSDGRFKPTDTITREEAMSMLARAMKITELTVKADIHDLEKFSDAAQIAVWAKNDVAVTLQAGIVNGADASVLKPKSLITRAEVATMVERLLQQSGMI